MAEDQTKQLKSLDDDRLVRAARSGDGRAWEVLIQRYRPLVRAEAGRLYLRGGEHDDLLQEATIGLIKAIDSYDEDLPTGFAGYAKRCVRNQVTDALRRDSGKQASLLSNAVSLDGYESGVQTSPEPADPEAGRPFDRIENEAAFVSVVEELGELTSDQRKVLLAYAMGNSQRKISEQMGISLRQVRKLLGQAREALKHLL